MKRLAHRLILAQGLDVAVFAAFVLLVPVSIHAERNPLIAIPYAIGGFGAVGIMKMSVALFASYIATHQEIHFKRSVVVLMSTATAAGIAGAGFSLASLVDSLRQSY